MNSIPIFPEFYANYAQRYVCLWSFKAAYTHRDLTSCLTRLAGLHMTRVMLEKNCREADLLLTATIGAVSRHLDLH